MCPLLWQSSKLKYNFCTNKSPVFNYKRGGRFVCTCVYDLIEFLLILVKSQNTCVAYISSNQKQTITVVLLHSTYSTFGIRYNEPHCTHGFQHNSVGFPQARLPLYPTKQVQLHTQIIGVIPSYSRLMVCILHS